ncbi:FRG domain-containing protein [Claveliimonas bilis]|uniref:FRG domain-containing protein n=1 Tax=Claveliimonas bilis TaxID=3028070 RepID=A0ABM8I1D4_9FIRM|nr:FRG domain-containing protein [Claveliimonas bilis]BDZ76310.1 hypothetical protein Lac1_04930 [Claveliimonas bilis]BDZ79746.1 hypothetical protein Lac3_09550 [Claveliimonas bilis]
MIKYFYADSLKAYFECIREIEEVVIGRKNVSGNYFSVEKPPILWYRGLSHVTHSLTPSLYRGKENGKGTEKYSSLHNAEEIRTQHYIAKNYHYFNLKPSSRIEWLEVMQHHGMKTRVLDWSESSVHSLIFALGAFFELIDCIANDKQTSMPCVWVMDPGGLNKEIFKEIANEITAEHPLFWTLDLKYREKKRINNILNELKRVLDKEENFFEEKDVTHLNYILNLSAIHDEYIQNLPQIKALLLQGEVVPIIYYILLRIYSEGYIQEKKALPPLSIVNPYHSERIKAQKGVFSVFPFYKEEEIDKKLRKMGIVPEGMENNKVAQDYLYKIVLLKPQRIVEEMIANGMDGGWLYPELPTMAKLIENHKVE